MVNRLTPAFDRSKLSCGDRGCVKVVEPDGRAVNRIYDILWKKQSLDIAELARMRFEEKFGSRVISQRLGLPRTTVASAIRRLENRMA